MRDYFSILLLIFLISCNQDTPGQNTTEQEKTRAVVILYDVSASIDTSAAKPSTLFRKITDQSAQIIRSYPPGTHFRLFFVSRNSVPSPFLDFESPKMHKGNIGTVRNLFRSYDKRIAQAIDSASKNPESQSCILSSIEAAATMLIGSGNARQSDVLVFSDMLEVCYASPLDTLIMSNRAGKETLSKTQMEKINSYGKSAINFDENRIRMKILLSTTGMDNKTVRSLETAWRLLLERYHYSAAKNTKIPLFLFNHTFSPDHSYTLIAKNNQWP